MSSSLESFVTSFFAFGTWDASSNSYVTDGVACSSRVFSVQLLKMGTSFGKSEDYPARVIPNLYFHLISLCWYLNLCWEPTIHILVALHWITSWTVFSFVNYVLLIQIDQNEHSYSSLVPILWNSCPFDVLSKLYKSRFHSLRQMWFLDFLKSSLESYWALELHLLLLMQPLGKRYLNTFWTYQIFTMPFSP